MDGLSDGVLGALIGAGAALLTALLTVGLGWLVASRQLRHDREERATDRALQSKRERLFTSLASASEIARSVTNLARPELEVQATASRFNESVTTLAAAGSVASLEVVARGRDLVGRAGRLFLVAIAKRRWLEEEGTGEEWIAFADWAVHSQIELQNAYALLMASVRRDLQIPGSSDAEVLEATKADVLGLLAAAEEAKGIVFSGAEIAPQSNRALQKSRENLTE